MRVNIGILAARAENCARDRLQEIGTKAARMNSSQTFAIKTHRFLYLTSHSVHDFTQEQRDMIFEELTRREEEGLQIVGTEIHCGDHAPVFRADAAIPRYACD